MRVSLNIKSYKPQTANIRPWLDIEQRYADLIHNQKFEFGPMLQLVRHIIATKLSERLFAFTSMHKLVVGIYNPMEWDREALHIEFDADQQKWFFVYHPKPNEQVEFERQYAADEGVEKFDSFVRMMKW